MQKATSPLLKKRRERERHRERGTASESFLLILIKSQQRKNETSFDGVNLPSYYYQVDFLNRYSGAWMP
ncbi:hypothetical protein FKM82_006086 [Ascaphus truei]